MFDEYIDKKTSASHELLTSLWTNCYDYAKKLRGPFPETQLKIKDTSIYRLHNKKIVFFLLISSC
jgi:hypothetical protein